MNPFFRTEKRSSSILPFLVVRPLIDFPANWLNTVDTAIPTRALKNNENNQKEDSSTHQRSCAHRVVFSGLVDVLCLETEVRTRG